MSNDVRDSASSFAGSNFAFISATLAFSSASFSSAAASVNWSSLSYWSLRPSMVSCSGLSCSSFSYSASNHTVSSALVFLISSAVGAGGAAGEHAAAKAISPAANKRFIVPPLHFRTAGLLPGTPSHQANRAPCGATAGQEPGGPRQPAFTLSIQRFTRASSTGNGSAPPPSTVSWKPAIVNLSPSSFWASARSSWILIMPIL